MQEVQSDFATRAVCVVRVGVAESAVGKFKGPKGSVVRRINLAVQDADYTVVQNVRGMSSRVSFMWIADGLLIVGVCVMFSLLTVPARARLRWELRWWCRAALTEYNRSLLRFRPCETHTHTHTPPRI